MTFSPRTSAEHLEEILAGVVTRSKLSNVRPSAPLLKLAQVTSEKFEAADIAIYQLRALIDIDKSTGPDLDDIAEAILPEGQGRLGATRATSTIALTRPSTSGVVPIPVGTVVAQEREGVTYQYETTAAGSWLNGQATCAPIPIKAQLEGSASSAIVGAINVMVSNISVTNVTNPTPATGQDEESDPQLRQRLRDYVRSLPRCNRSAQLAAVRKVTAEDGTAVLFAKSAGHELGPPRGVIYIDDGRGTAGTSETVAGETLVSNAAGGERLLYTSRRPWKTAPIVKKNGAILALGVDYTVVEPWGQVRLSVALTAGQSVTVEPYDVYTGLVAAAQRVIDGDPSDPVGFPGYAADGTVIYVLPAEVVPATHSGSLVMRAGYDQATGRSAAQTAILEYVNGLDIGAPRFVSRIIERAMSIPGALRYTPAIYADVYVQPQQVQRATAADIVIS